MEIIYRKAFISELHDIFRLYRQSAQIMNDNGLYQWDDLYPAEKDIEDDIKKDQLYIGTIGGKTALAFSLSRDFDEEFSAGKWTCPDDSFYVIHRLCVDPQFRKMGLAQAAMAHIESSLREIGVQSVRLDTFEENVSAFALYQKLGYKTVGYADFRTGRSHLMEKKL